VYEAEPEERNQLDEYTQAFIDFKKI